jgi:iron complex outermembrane receptor protein
MTMPVISRAPFCARLKRGDIFRLIGLLVAQALFAPALSGQTLDDLREMTLEELMQLEITTVSRFAEPSTTVPAAVFVITAEDIHRSGVTSIPEALRLAPGMQVARIDAGKWSIGVRGFADRLARSMLVLIDGRAVYSPLFAGTYWETQDIVLDDVARIEIIRGPGGTLWGSNAVNGIINIVMLPADETQGVLAEVAAGSEEVLRGTLRYGTSFGEDTYARAYLKGFDWDSQFHTGDVEYDEWRLVQGGLRLDSDFAGGRRLSLQGHAHTARLGEFVRRTSFTPPFLEEDTSRLPLTGGSAMARFTGPLASSLDFQAQSFYEWTDREEYPVSESRRTFDVDLQFRHVGFDRHSISWGAGYQLSDSDLDTSDYSSLPSGSEDLWSAFLQDEISVAGDRLHLTVGAKLEHNDYSGLEVQPTGRVAWLVTPNHILWAAVSRAVRRPSRVEREYASTSILNPAGPAFVRLLPNLDFESEKLIGYEVGYRALPEERVYLTVSTFYNRWSDLLTTDLFDVFQEDDPPPTRTIFPVSFLNGLDGESYGIETWADLWPTPWWRTRGHYAFLRVVMTPKPGSRDITQRSRYEDGSPRHQARLQNSFDLPRGVSFDWYVRYQSKTVDPDLPAYTTSDVRIGWEVTPGLELEVLGRNLHEPHHAEWPGENGGADVEIERGVSVGVSWRQ